MTTLLGDRLYVASYSELSTLADCEQKWVFRYGGEKIPTPPSTAMARGTLLHAGINGFWDTADWHLGLEQGLEELSTEWDPALWMTEDLLPDVEWLLDRYAEVYYEMARAARVEHVEKELIAAVPHADLRIKGFVDRFVIINGQRWLVETKTMRDWGRLDLVTVDPQLTLYFWLAEQNDLKPYGILFDAIRTYRWKTEKPTQKALIEQEEYAAAVEGRMTEWAAHGVKSRDWARAAVELHPGVDRPAHESFNQVWLDRSPEQVQAALNWAMNIQSRRMMLNLGSPPIRNVNVYCKTCPYRDECFDQMAFPPVGEIEMELD